MYDRKQDRMVPLRNHRNRDNRFITGAKDLGDPDMAVPRALRSMGTTEENKFIRESGYSPSHVRRVWEM